MLLGQGGHSGGRGVGGRGRGESGKRGFVGEYHKARWGQCCGGRWEEKGGEVGGSAYDYKEWSEVCKMSDGEDGGLGWQEGSSRAWRAIRGGGCKQLQ